MTRFHYLLPTIAFVAATIAAFPAQAGLCTGQIAQVEHQISAVRSDPSVGPSAPQTVGAQLGRQPTVQTVRRAEMTADALAHAALVRVKKADAAGNAAACTKALSALKEWYGL